MNGFDIEEYKKMNKPLLIEKVKHFHIANVQLIKENELLREKIVEIATRREKDIKREVKEEMFESFDEEFCSWKDDFFDDC